MTNTEHPRALASPEGGGLVDLKLARGARGAPQKFGVQLYKLLANESPDIVSWNKAGTAFQIKDPKAFSSEVLTKYFRHSKVSSFQRQLNLYEFHKSSESRFYEHPMFRRGHPELLQYVRRASTGANNARKKAPSKRCHKAGKKCIGKGRTSTVRTVRLPYQCSAGSKDGTSKIPPCTGTSTGGFVFTKPQPQPPMTMANMTSPSIAVPLLAPVAVGTNRVETAEVAGAEKEQTKESRVDEPLQQHVPLNASENTPSSEYSAACQGEEKEGSSSNLPSPAVKAPIEDGQVPAGDQRVAGLGGKEELAMVDQLATLVADVDLSDFLGWGKRGEEFQQKPLLPCIDDIRGRGGSLDRLMAMSFDFDNLDDKENAAAGARFIMQHRTSEASLQGERLMSMSFDFGDSLDDKDALSHQGGARAHSVPSRLMFPRGRTGSEVVPAV
ncbi:unnamed protein product [Chrysoparadoxa australica]